MSFGRKNMKRGRGKRGKCIRERKEGETKRKKRGTKRKKGGKELRKGKK
jgi:hypothetical protein